MKSLLINALEEVSNENDILANPVVKDETKGKREDEIVFYALMSNPEGLRLASDKEAQEQWEIKKRRGRVRVRKTSKEGLEPTYRCTFKTKSENAGIMGSIENDHDIDSSFFESFKGLSSEGMIKERYFFPIQKVQVTTDAGAENIEVENAFYEVDVFFNADGTQSNYIKIDLELNRILDAINEAKPDLGDFNLNVKILDLPFKPTNVIISDKNTSEEDKQKISTLYDEVFLTKK